MHFKLCKKHEGAHMTYNTMECCKYEMDSGWTPKKAFLGRNVQGNSRGSNTMSSLKSAYVQLSAKIVKLEKSNKKLKHTTRSASMITTVTSMTLTRPEVMGMEVWGNWYIVVRNINVLK